MGNEIFRIERYYFPEYTILCTFVPGSFHHARRKKERERKTPVGRQTATKYNNVNKKDK